MITKAVIISAVEGTNKFNIRIPIFESAGNSSDLMSDKITYEATVSYMPGILNAYLPGDIVYVGFEDNDYENIIILGKLYQGNEVDPVSYAKLDKLYVNSSTEINGQLKVNGVDLDIVNEHNQAISNLVKKTSSIDDLGDWTIESNRQGLVLNFYRNKSN